MPGQVESIVALQQTLNELSAAEGRLHGIPEWMKELHEEHQSRKAEIEAVEETAASAAQRRRESDAAISDAQEKLARYQAQISQVSTQREYGALLKEIDAVKQEIAAAEQVAVVSLEEIEAAEKERDRLREDFRDLDERYQTEAARWEKEKPGVAKSVAKLERRAQTLREAIPRGVQTLFDRLVGRTSAQALARVAKGATPRRKGNAFWHCTACHYRVRPQVVVELRNLGSLIQCESCKRILYIDDSAGSES